MPRVRAARVDLRRVHETVGRTRDGRPVPCEGRTCETDPYVRETPVRTCTSATAYVVVRIVVAPRPRGRLRRAGNGGRGRSDPPFSMPAVASGEVGMCTPSQPPRRVAPGQQSHAGRPNGEPERARPGLGRRCRTARRPDGRATGPPAPRSGARHPSGTDCWLGVTPQRRGGWGCPAPSPLAPIEVCRDGGSLPATSKERRLASALRWPWCNRKRTSDMDGRGRVRPNGDSVSGDPQSEPDTQDLPPTPASGGQNGSPDRRLDATTGRTLEVETPSGYAFASATTLLADLLADTRAVTTVGAALRHHAAPTRGKGAAPPMRDLQGCAILGGIEGGQGHPSPAPVYYTG